MPSSQRQTGKVPAKLQVRSSFRIALLQGLLYGLRKGSYKVCYEVDRGFMLRVQGVGFKLFGALAMGSFGLRVRSGGI